MSAAPLLGLVGAVAAGCGSREDSSAASTPGTVAKAREVAVVAYDALIDNAELDYFVSFHDERVGELQGTALLDKTPWKGRTS
jgi:D-xylose transport system substrate-binding protein